MNEKNTIPINHKLNDGMLGQNYHFNGCAACVMECLGEPDYDYSFFAGLTGDNFAQIFSHDHFRGDGVTDYLLGGNFGEDELNGSHIESVFAACGYESKVIFKKELLENREAHLQTLMGYIDLGVPVIQFGYGCDDVPPWGVFIGYEDTGETLLFLTGSKDEPRRVSLDEATTNWIFVGEKKEQKDLRQLYRDIIKNMPKLLTTKTDDYCFGAEAFRAWADDIESGKFAGMKPEEFDGWGMYTCYVCALATNSGGAQDFMRRAMKIDPGLAFLRDVCYQYRVTGMLWNTREDGWYLYDCPKNHGGPCRKEQGCRNCKQLTPEQAKFKKQYKRVKGLEQLGGGFNIKLKTLQKPNRKRAKIVATIRQCADCMDEAVRILNANIESGSFA